MKFDIVGKVYIVTILIKANQRFSISKVFDNNKDACAYRDKLNKLLSEDDPYVCEVIEVDVERRRTKSYREKRVESV